MKCTKVNRQSFGIYHIHILNKTKSGREKCIGREMHAMQADNCAYARVHLCMHACTYVFKYVYMYVCVYICIYEYRY